ncbi:hypothetical protein F2Q68_00043952 [Brassica cretica]|uniref:NAD(+) ADP-ribosyltransferase n=1 Tax=Brassica cretica TaxID=69181 RepID=A0A8S9LQL5_BRACR|nr:hypothetical protein F2Q68_00043952 [Brassica cretica]
MIKALIPMISKLIQSDPHPAQFHNKLTYYLYQRWGRVGVKGQTKLHGPFNNESFARVSFTNKFSEKTKTYFKPSNVQTTSFIPSSICLNLYTPILTDYNSSAGGNLSYDANKLPLGKLSKSTILKGYEVLKSISKVIEEQQDKIINEETQARLEELSGSIPSYLMILGFYITCEFVINTPEKLRQKLDMVEALNKIGVAKKVLSSSSDSQHLRCDLTPISKDSEEFSMIAEYIENTRYKRRHEQRPKITQVFRTTLRTNLPDDFNKDSAMARILLWHESRLTNWASIFNQRTGLYNNHQVFKLLLPKLLIEVFVGRLLKGEVLGSRNAKRTNNLIMESETVPCRAVSLGS